MPFLITELDENIVLQNVHNIYIIKDKAMIELIKYLDENGVQIIDKELLDRFFIDKIDAATKFLVGNKIIEKVKAKAINYDKVRIFSNDNIISKSIEFNSSGIQKKILLHEINDISDDSIHEMKEDLCVLILNPFNYHLMTSLISKFQKENILVRVCFYYNNKFYLSNYYKREWYNPCPLCFFAHLESCLRSESKHYNTTSFQTILDLIYSKKPMFNIQNLFTNYAALSVVQSILRGIENIDNKDIIGIIAIDINSNTLVYEQALHWELCDCYE